MGLLFDPNTYDPSHFDPETRRQLRAVIDWFEERGKAKLLRDDLEAAWVSDFLDFIKQERIFATFLTPSEYGGGDPNKRWDTSRNAALSEIFGFYGLSYWYAEQVTILGLGPIWQSDNIKAKERAAAQLEAGGVMAFALSEREHGADIYNTDLLLTPADDGRRRRGRVPRVGGEVLHRQRQRGRHGVGVLPPHRRRRRRRLRVVRRRQRPPELRTDRQRGARPDVRQQLPAQRLPGARGGHPVHRPGRVLRRAQHRQRRQVQPVLRLDRDVRARLLRGDHPRQQPHPVRQPGHRLPARAGQFRRGLRPAGRDETVQRPRDRLLPQRQPRRPSLPAVQPGDQSPRSPPKARRWSRCCGMCWPPRASRRTPTSAKWPG